MTKPNPHFEFISGETKKPLFMSFGLLNTLTGLFDSINDIPRVFLDGATRLNILILVLSERDNMGFVTKEAAVNELEVDTDHLLELFDWVEAHVTYFFIQAWKKSQEKTNLRAKMLRDSG